jgi:uncharacterized protein (DUF111 family)
MNIENIIAGSMIAIAANIDDMNPEVYSYLLPLLLERKALDAFLNPSS